MDMIICVLAILVAILMMVMVIMMILIGMERNGHSRIQ